jgi:hypothetical protein
MNPLSQKLGISMAMIRPWRDGNKMGWGFVAHVELWANQGGALWGIISLQACRLRLRRMALQNNRLPQRHGRLRK